MQSLEKFIELQSYSTWLHGEMLETQRQRHLYLTG